MKLVLHKLRQLRVPTITKPLIVHLFGIAGTSITKAVHALSQSFQLDYFLRCEPFKREN